MDFLDKPTSETPLPELDYSEPPQGSDRRTFMMRSALAAAMVSLTGRPLAAFAQQPTTTPATPPGTPATPPLGASLDVHRRARGPIQTTVEEILQGRARAVLVAHDRADADHLRFLSALRPSFRPTSRPGRPR